VNKYIYISLYDSGTVKHKLTKRGIESMFLCCVEGFSLVKLI